MEGAAHRRGGDPDGSAARAAAATAVRRLGHALMAHEVDDELLQRVAEQVDGLAIEAERAGRRHRDIGEVTRRMFEEDIPDHAPVVHFDECFVSGPWNPLGIGIEVVRDGEAAVAQIVLGTAFEGGPGMAHGGIVAALFDDVLGYLLTLHGIPGFTGELTVRYLRPTPVETPLSLRGWVVERSGRRLRTAAQLHAGDELVASATAVFVEIDAARLWAARG
ncbi:MAG: PaaI family thioesterase [Nitriliruptor sp.]|nr:MAG: PaaI family thioesterase [Nitriliruptor sp.]